MQKVVSGVLITKIQVKHLILIEATPFAATIAIASARSVQLWYVCTIKYTWVLHFILIEATPVVATPHSMSRQDSDLCSEKLLNAISPHIISLPKKSICTHVIILRSGKKDSYWCIVCKCNFRKIKKFMNLSSKSKDSARRCKIVQDGAK